MSTQTIHSAKAHADDMPLDRIDVSNPQLFRDGIMWPYFERLRREDPVHYCGQSAFGPYWSITKYKDIMQVDTNHAVFSSEGGISILDRPEEFRTPNFISMDPPRHDEQRKTVSPIVAPGNLANSNTSFAPGFAPFWTLSLSTRPSTGWTACPSS